MIKLASMAATAIVGTTLVAAPMAPASAHVMCGPFLPLCVAGAIVAGAATVATLPFAAAAAATAPYAPPPAYYPAPAYVAPAPAYAAPAPAYYGYPAYGYYPAPVVTVGVRPYWYRSHWVRGPYRRWHHY
jgi:hypothetical protein